MPFLSVLLGFALTPAQVFDASLAAHSHLMKGDVSVTIETKLKTQDLKSSARLRFIEPDRLSLSVQEPVQNGLAASRRTYTLLGHRFVAVDDVEGEYTERDFPFPEKLGLSDRLMTTLGSPGDAVGAILSPPDMQKFYANFRTLPDMRASTSGAFVVLKRSAPGVHVEFDFGASDHLLRKVRLDNPQGFLLWTFTYGAGPSSIAPPRIAGLHKVESLTARPAPPKYESPAAQALARKAAQAYARMSSVKCTYTGPEGNGVFYVSGGRYRQDSGGASWTFAGSVLQISSQNAVYRGKSSLIRVPGFITAARGYVQPLLLQVMQQRNPMSTLTPTEAVVRLAGELVIAGAPCGILEIRSRGIRVNVTVRKEDGLIVSTRTTIAGPRGPAAREESTYRYEGLNKPIASSVFALGTGSAQPLLKPVR